MKVILLEDIKGTGKKGDVAEVSAGHARNFLIPRKLVVEASPKAMQELKQQEAKQQRIREKELAAAKEIAGKLESLIVKIPAKAGETGRLFGAVTGKEIVEALQEQHGIAVEKNKIVQSEPIKAFGSYQVKVKLGSEVSGTIHVVVAEK